MIVAQRLAIATALLTLVLIGVGALVRATGSGLGCPDWPLCHGGAVPPGHQEAVIEYSHRVVASVVGLMVIAVAVVAWRYYREFPLITWLATAIVPLVGFQGLLGAITVERELPPEIVATHLLVAMIVLSCQVTVAIAMYMEDPSRAASVARLRGGPRIPGALALYAIGWLTLVLWIGGYMAESGASTACEGWPLCNGSILPASDDHEVTHMVHRYLAGAFVFLIIPAVVAAWRGRKSLRWAGPYAILLAALYVAQVLVGALNVWYTFPDGLTISHTVIAACIWFTLSAAAALTYYVPGRGRRTSAIRKAGLTA